MTTTQQDSIRAFYRDWTPRSSPYGGVDWNEVFSPIEDNVWSDIRYLGLPFYPQWPVGQFFIDFADPVKKIGIEVDGKEFHIDKASDEGRTRILQKKGWEILRLEGRQTFGEYGTSFERCNKSCGTDYGDMCDWHQAKYENDTSEGILRKLKDSVYRL